MSPRFAEVVSSYSSFTLRVLTPVGPSILPRSTMAALPASSSRVASNVFFSLGGMRTSLSSHRQDAVQPHCLRGGPTDASELTAADSDIGGLSGGAQKFPTSVADQRRPPGARGRAH